MRSPCVTKIHCSQGQGAHFNSSGRGKYTVSPQEGLGLWAWFHRRRYRPVLGRVDVRSGLGWKGISLLLVMLEGRLELDVSADDLILVLILILILILISTSIFNGT